MKSISCKEAVGFLLKNEEGKLSLLQRLSLWRHLVICNLCRIFSVQNRLMNDAMHQRRSNHSTLSGEEKENIIRNVLNKNQN
jgi:hypothetical protein